LQDSLEDFQAGFLLADLRVPARKSLFNTCRRNVLISMDTMLLTGKVPLLSIFRRNVFLYSLLLCIGRFAATTNALNIDAGTTHVQFEHNPAVAIPQGGHDFSVLQHSESSAINEDLTSFNLRCFLCKEAVVKYRARLESKTLEAEAAVGGLCKELKLQKDDVVSLALSVFRSQNSSVVPFTPLFALLLRIGSHLDKVEYF
jgi:hypothetical protein